MTDKYKHKIGDCSDCEGPCKGHKLVACGHLPGSRTCGVCTLDDSDDTSPQALLAEQLKTRKYASAR